MSCHGDHRRADHRRADNDYRTDAPWIYAQSLGFFFTKAQHIEPPAQEQQGNRTHKEGIDGEEKIVTVDSG